MPTYLQPATEAEKDELIKLADRAIAYALNRAQTDPDFAWTSGFGSETFARFCAYEAARTKHEEDAIRDARSKDLQPAHSKRPPSIPTLRKALEEVLDALPSERSPNLHKAVEKAERVR